MAAVEDIDDSLFSRGRYVFGDRAMKSMQSASVFLSGLGGVGVEAAWDTCLMALCFLPRFSKTRKSHFYTLLDDR